MSARHQVAAALLPCVVVRGNDYYMVTIVIQLWVFEDIDQAKMISIQCHIGGGAAQRDSEQRPGPRATVVAAYCIVAWWQLLNFIECQAKFNRFLNPNEHVQRIFWYLARLFESELSKIGNFQSSESFLEAKFHFIFLKMIFSSEYQSRRTPFIKYIYNLKHFHQSLFCKNVP